jgi:hypothetical protein
MATYTRVYMYKSRNVNRIFLKIQNPFFQRDGCLRTPGIKTGRSSRGQAISAHLRYSKYSYHDIKNGQSRCLAVSYMGVPFVGNSLAQKLEISFCGQLKCKKVGKIKSLEQKGHVVR